MLWPRSGGTTTALGPRLRLGTCVLLLPHLIAASTAVTNGVFGTPDQARMGTARDMQALSLSVHIPLVCFGIAFPSIVLFMEGLYLRTGNPVYKAVAKRWSKVMITLFAVGVVTGTILTFEFGLLWPNFMGTFGGVFGLAFTLEGISFFVEGIFVGIYVYSWNRISPKKHFLVGLPVAAAGVVGALMVITVNAWMNHPSGFTLNSQGVVTSAQPFKALFDNGFVWHQIVHMYIAGYLVCGFLVAGVYAWGWTKGRRSEYHRAALIVPLTIAVLAVPVQLVIGDWAARTVVKYQPIKLASMEGLPQTTTRAPFQFLGVYHSGNNTISGGIVIPDMLSILATHNPNGTVVGLASVPKDDRPPAINVVRYAFQIMISVATALTILTAWFVGSWWLWRRLPRSKIFYWLVVIAGPACIAALISGWIVTEVGRQPWVVYNIMRSTSAVTAAGGLRAGMTALIVVYSLLAVGVVWLLRRLSRHPVETELTAHEQTTAPAGAA